MNPTQAQMTHWKQLVKLKPRLGQLLAEIQAIPDDPVQRVSVNEKARQMITKKRGTRMDEKEKRSRRSASRDQKKARQSASGCCF